MRSEPLPPFSGGTWRVDWWAEGATHQSRSFPPAKEADARAYCAARRAAIDAEWTLLSDVDIRRPT